MSIPAGYQTDLAAVMDHLKAVLERKFAKNVSQVYWGDIMVYPPRVFKDRAGASRCVIALIPEDDQEDESQASFGAEEREYLIRIQVMVNITPYFEAQPVEAIAERLLVETTQEIAAYLRRDDHLDLGGRVQFTKVPRIQYGVMQRKALYLRSASIMYRVRVTVDR